MKHEFLSVLVSAAFVFGASTALAQYPEKAVRLIVPFAAGGPTDIVARSVAEKMGQLMGQPVIVDNRAGAGGSLGTNIVAKAPNDGYTLGVAAVSTHAVNPACNPKGGYDPVRDFTPVALVARVPNALIVRSDFPANTVKELIALAHANPGKYVFASTGQCGFGHLILERFKLATKTNILHVPYRGSGPAQIDLLGGQASMVFDALPGNLAMIKAGKLKALALSWDKRLESMPDVPTFAEMGIPEANVSSWYGIVAPAGTSPAIIAKLHAVATRAMQDKDLIERFHGAGMVPISDVGPGAFRNLIVQDYASMQNVIQVQQIKME